jgi:hypothetical protein
MTSFWRRSTWTPLGRLLLLRCSTPALHLRLLSHSLPHRHDSPTATTTRTRTTSTAMAATAARTITTVVVVVVTLATPPRPLLDPPTITAGPLLHGRRTSTYGRGTSPCTTARYLWDSSVRMLSYPRQVTTRP